MRKIWDIPGGVHPPENKTQSNHCPIGSIALPDEIVLPLNQHIGAPALAIVNVGEHVLKGQKIAEAQGLISTPVHASTSGIVCAVEERCIPHASGMTSPCVVITPDGEDRWIELEPCEDFTELDKQELVEKIRHAGIAGMGGAGFPTSVKLSPRANYVIHTLILNGTECEPYITADDMLMRERAHDIIQGAKLLAHLLGQPDNVMVGIEDNKPEAIAAMKRAAEGSNIEIVSFPTKYPSGGEKQLIQILTGKEVPQGDIPASIGIVLQNVGTALAAYRAVRYGEPLISRVTTVVGESLQIQSNIDVLLGTPIDFVLSQHGHAPQKSARLIVGGPMMGFAMEHSQIPVIKTTNCILVPSHEEMPAPPPAQACIRCGMCAEACPASLLPQQLFWFSQSEDFDKLHSHNLFDCIECGACSYVCPSNIPLVQYYRASKGTIRQLEAEKQKSDRSRQRFEFRQERIAKAEAEKEAKRLERKKAAEEAKKKLAEKQAQGNTHSEADNTDLVAAAIERAKSQQNDPASQRAKLERALSSAKSRVERAEKQLEKGKAEGDLARIESLEARLKQAQLKVKEAEDKLSDAAGVKPEEKKASDNLIEEKLNASPVEKQKKSVDTIKKRLATAKEKLAEAEQNEAPTQNALRQGVEKLQIKLNTAESELAELEKTSALEKGAQDSTTMKVGEKSAAEKAIEKAKAKAAAQATMTDAEKAAALIASLEARLEKSRARLAKAEEENNENIDAFRAGVDKLEQKLAEAKKSPA